MKEQTRTGHRYEFDGRKYMVVEPTGELLKSTLLRDKLQSTKDTVVVDLSSGLLHIHKYPESNYKIWYHSFNTGVKHGVAVTDRLSTFQSIHVLYNKYGKGTIVCPEIGRAYWYDGDDSMLFDSLKMIYTLLEDNT